MRNSLALQTSYPTVKNQIKRKNQRLKLKLIAEKRFFSRKVSKKVHSIASDFPDIGKDIENNNSVGADSWRRTGVLTFDGNRKLGKKVTYNRI